MISPLRTPAFCWSVRIDIPAHHGLPEVIAQVFRIPDRAEIGLQEVHEIAEQRRAGFAANLLVAAVSHGRCVTSCLPSVLKRWKSLKSLTTLALRYIRSGSPFLVLSNLKCCNMTRRGRKTSNLLGAKSKSTSITL